MSWLLKFAIGFARKEDAPQNQHDPSEKSRDCAVYLGSSVGALVPSAPVRKISAFRRLTQTPYKSGIVTRKRLDPLLAGFSCRSSN